MARIWGKSLGFFGDCFAAGHPRGSCRLKEPGIFWISFQGRKKKGTPCHLCEEVCQTGLPLVQAWNELEAQAEKVYGRPFDSIEGFVKKVEKNEAFLNLIAKQCL